MDCRKIIHIDMDAFFASVEQRDNPAYRGKPLAVGGGGERGVVAAASYEARKFGVRSAMPGIQARKKCPQIIFVKPRFDVYKAVSRQIQQIFLEYTDWVEPLSLDEAYLDVTQPKKGKHSATLIANEIRQRIFAEVGLTASAGISCNKFLAKIASDINKPNGYFVIHPKDAARFIEELPIEKFHGVGKVTAEKFRNLGIHNGSDLKDAGLETLVKHFGKNGLFFFDIAHGKDTRLVEPQRDRKSIGAENTFTRDLADPQELHMAMEEICNTLVQRMNRASAWGRTLTIKVKYHDFQQITRSKSFSGPLLSGSDILRVSCELLFEHRDPQKPIRLLGITLSQLETPGDHQGKQLRIPYPEEGEAYQIIT